MGKAERERIDQRREDKEIQRLHRELRGADENRPERAPKAERAAVAGNAIIGDQLSYAPVGATDGGQMGRIRKTQLEKEGHSWDMNERSTKVGEVTDSLGRRRFHGAFTGGQSAGYFMSVGSKEGWTPQTFRSSRADRNKKQQSVDDFMDDEDREEEMTGGKTLTTTAQFTSFAGLGDDPVGRPATISSGGGANIVGSAASSGFGGGPEPLGWKLLKTMGWREGDQVGAQISKERKKEMKAAAPSLAPGEKKVYGAMLPPGGLSAFHQKMQGVLGAAPKKQVVSGPIFGSGDAVALLKRGVKKDFYGLGYNPHHDAPEFASAAAATQQARLEKDQRSEYERAAGQTNKQSFGDDDDYDHVYGKESMAQYDLTLDDDVKPKSRMKEVPEESSRLHRARPGDSSAWLKKNFVESAQAAQVPPWWAPPKVPKGFNPRHVFSDGDQGATEAHKAAVKQFQASGRGLLDHNGRAGLLGEKQHKPEQPDTEVREVGQGPSQDQENKLIEAGCKVKAQGKGAYNPYPEDEPKAKRYATFVSELAGLKDAEDEQGMETIGGACVGNEEKEEFCKVVYMFQPRVSVLNNHFQSCDDLAVEGDVRKEQGKKPMEVAAQKGAFGAATREVLEWRPAPLLCKRANVRNPFPGGDKVGTQRLETPAGFGHLPKSMIEAIAEELVPGSARDKNPVKKAKALEFVEPEPEPEPVAVDKPSMDMFKAIFDDSSDEDDEDDEKLSGAPAEVAQVAPHPPSSAPPHPPSSPPPASVQADDAPEPVASMEVDTPSDPPIASSDMDIDIGPLPPPSATTTNPLSAPAKQAEIPAPAASEEQQEEAPKIMFRKPPTKRRTKKRPTAADFMNKSGM